ncbi:tetratricopeptide repeat-containing sulfotransferase family protein [Sphingomicrobium nitratireducens]|uniref:tetratricopeptide repeat-containing sulfotransferase family protein n=1 Tax=Sphingomicrobium nitratireducens TaxID=2964666 RepID=UPI00224065ED|nr:sulfotransferase [Sphingomicrobium nitratireducens]
MEIDLQRQVERARQEPRLLRAGEALVANDLPVAEQLLRPYLKERPTDVFAIRMMAELAARVGRLPDSENLLRRALELAPDFTAARANLATVLYKQNRSGEAIAELERIEKSGEAGLGHHSLKAAALSRIGGQEEALALYRLILDARPDEPKLWMSYGHLQRTVGEQAECIDAYRKAIALEPTLGEVWWSLANLKTVKFDNDDVAAMNAALEVPNLDMQDRFHLHFALGKALEDRREVDASFSHYAQANRLRRAIATYDPQDIARHVERSIAVFTPDLFAAHAGEGCGRDDPIFVLGMPRAGSTLVEQILASHPAIEGTAELPDIPALVRRLDGREMRGDDSDYPECLVDIDGATLKALGEEYLDRARIQRFTDRPFFIDKLPNNWAHVGFIRLILPNARIIDARRDPMDCCFSNFKQHYARGQRFSYDLADIGAYYRDYVTLMRHFDDVLPGVVHRVIHEDLVEDPETQVRAMLDFLGLSFDPACLAFHENPRAVRTASSEQVRQPITRSGIGRWMPYEPWLDPLKQALGTVLEDWRR